MMEETKKRCSNCGLYKSLTAFHPYTGAKARSKDGYRNECIRCRNKKRMEYYYRNKGAQ